MGKNADAMNLAGLGVRKIDLGGKTLLPGFIDPRFRLEHCAVVNDGLIARASQGPE